MENNMPPLNLPRVDLKLKNESGIVKVWDPVREGYFALTPEEFVRQHFINWLSVDRKIPLSYMANEVSIDLNGTRKRCDTVVYDRSGQPLLIVEYKAPGVQITQDTFDQIVRYNMVLQVRYLAVSNGINHYFCKIDLSSGTYNFIRLLPTYQEMTTPFSNN